MDHGTGSRKTWEASKSRHKPVNVMCKNDDWNIGLRSCPEKEVLLRRTNIKKNLLFWKIMIIHVFKVVAYNVSVKSPNEVTNHKSALLTISQKTCNIIGYSLYYFGISKFCWMSVMCYDLFLTFGRKKSAASRCQNRHGNVRLMFYTTFACGLPFIMTMAIYLVNHFKLGNSFISGH